MRGVLWCGGCRGSGRVDVEAVAEHGDLLARLDRETEAVLRRRHRAVVLGGEAARRDEGAVEVEDRPGPRAAAIARRTGSGPEPYVSSPLVGSPKTSSRVPSSSNALSVYVRPVDGERDVAGDDQIAACRRCPGCARTARAPDAGTGGVTAPRGPRPGRRGRCRPGRSARIAGCVRVPEAQTVLGLAGDEVGAPERGHRHRAGCPSRAAAASGTSPAGPSGSRPGRGCRWAR